jgi:hypothetical protein
MELLITSIGREKKGIGKASGGKKTLLERIIYIARAPDHK